MTGGEGEASIVDKLHDHADHGPVREQMEQFASEAAMPYSIIGSSEIKKHSTGLPFSLKAVLDVLSHQDDLIHSRSFA